jgi:L,D-peptidoglycan transpeptidase YkuD (ErfK/YbiS/YcfS/YnhG family)
MHPIRKPLRRGGVGALLVALALVLSTAVAAGAASAGPASSAPRPAAAPDPDSPPLTYWGPARQLITVVADSAGSTTATLTAWERTDTGWRSMIGPVTAFVGAAGIGQASEGSTRTPAGAWALGQAFGRQPNPGTAMPYFRTDGNDWWNGNVTSPAYNTHVRQAANPGGASENLYGAGPVYDYAIDMGYNTARVPGAGSAMFLHVTDGRPSAGCVAIDRAALVSILQWLDPAKGPVIDIAVADGAARSPIGYLDSVQQPTVNTVRVAGWAIDPDRLRAPIDVHVYDFRPDGSTAAVAVRADQPRSDLPPLFPGTTAGHGYVASLTLTGTGRHTVCAYGINVESGGNSTLGCRAVDLPPPIGSYDAIGLSAGQITVGGWAADPGAPGQLHKLLVTMTGPAGTTYPVLTTGSARPDVALVYPWAGGNTGFGQTLAVQGEGQHQVCIGVPAAPQPPVSLGCRKIEVRNAFGFLDYVAGGSGRYVSLAGWALNPNNSGERVEIHVYDEGPQGRIGVPGYRADQPRPDVAAVFPGFDGHHGYLISVLLGPGDHRLCAYAITTGGGFANTHLGCGNVTVPF